MTNSTFVHTYGLAASSRYALVVHIGEADRRCISNYKHRVSITVLFHDLLRVGAQSSNLQKAGVTGVTWKE